MANWIRWVTSDCRMMVLVGLAICGCSGGTEPRDPHAGIYGAVLWTSEIHGSAPYSYLDVDGASYTVRLEDDGRASRRIIVPGGLNGGIYDHALSGTWRLVQPDSLVVTLTDTGVTIDGDTVVTDFPQLFSVRADTLRTEVFGTNQYHEVVILVRR